LVDPADASYVQPGLLSDNYYPDDINSDPLGLKPKDREELNFMVTRELQNGRLATLATARPYRFVQMMIPNHRKAPISHNYFA
jgi:hypothetical protein